MSAKHPIVAITGSSGAGTTTVQRTFEQIFRREGLNAAVVEGDSYHRYDRYEMKDLMAEDAAAGGHLSHFGPEANLFADLEATFQQYGETRHVQGYAATCTTSRRPRSSARSLAPSRRGPTCLPTPTCSSTRGCMAPSCTATSMSPSTRTCSSAWYRSINLEWIQKINRDCRYRGLLRRGRHRRHPSPHARLRALHNARSSRRTHVNFQRVPIVDTSNPFVSRTIPSPDESMLVIRFADSKGIDFPYLLSMLHDSFMSRPNTLVCPGGKMDLAMQLIFTPFIWRMAERRKKALAR